MEKLYVDYFLNGKERIINLDRLMIEKNYVNIQLNGEGKIINKTLGSEIVLNYVNRLKEDKVTVYS